jgi:hypothetical protein
MTAKDELKKLANGKYHQIRYELTEYSSGMIEVNCCLYIDPKISSIGKTWKDALNKMKINLGLSELKIDPNEAPREEKEKEE